MYSGRNLLKMILGSAYPGLSDHGWHLLTRNWAGYFIVMAVLNEAVWRTTTTDFWVAFKLWFFIPATFLFAAANVPMLMRHGLQLEEAKNEPPIPPPE
jgi:intracellular septation protein